jgi:hypothetical protein
VSGGGDGEAAIAVAVAALVVATGALAVAAPTEGQRYDGWLRLQPEQPLYLMDSSGDGYWLPLSHLGPSHLDDTSHAVIVDDSSVARLGRAPLNRQGFVYSLEAGAAVPSTREGAGDPAFSARMGLGVFATRDFGLLLGGHFSAAEQDGSVFNGRIMLEAQYLPLRLGIAHFGLAGEGGMAWLLHDAPVGTNDANGLYLGGSGLTQVAISTRLAATLRAGAAWLPTVQNPSTSAAGRLWAPEVSVGLAVY